MNTWRIGIWGDSITQGMRDRAGGGWVRRLRDACEIARCDMAVYNLGVSGANIKDLIARLPTEANARRPDIAVLCLGVNDSQFKSHIGDAGVTLEAFEQCLEKCVSELKQWTDQIVLIGPTEVVEEAATNTLPWCEVHYSNEGLHQYDHLIEQYAKQHDLQYISMRGVMQPEDYDDGLHPNATGHQKMFEQLMQHCPLEYWLPDGPEGQLPKRSAR